MDTRSCAFIGCHPTRFKFKYKENYTLCKKIKAALLEQAKTVYKLGVRQFYVGGALGVDMWAGEAVLYLKGLDAYPGVTLTCVIPFKGHDSQWDSPSVKRLARLLSCCDEAISACSAERSDAYKIRNYYLVDNAECLIAVHDNAAAERTGVSQTVNYARKRNREIVLIHPDTAKATSVITAGDYLANL